MQSKSGRIIAIKLAHGSSDFQIRLSYTSIAH